MAAFRATARRSFCAAARHAPIIAVHGGAWAIPDAVLTESLDGVAAAAEAGSARLELGHSALDAVEAAVNSLEKCPYFNAGRGGSLNAAGQVELDAVIVDGSTLAAGAVAGIGPVLHPVSVARKLMEETEHVLLVGAGATAFAREMGVPILDESDLVTPEARDEWRRMAAYGEAVSTFYNTRTPSHGHDTVGAVALDSRGCLAAATSTGGITFKRPGRVGDSPLLGAGALADNERGAISTTGHGESILRYTLASRVLERMRRGTGPPGESSPLGPHTTTPLDAVAGALEAMYARLDGGSGGAICISPTGELGIAFTSARMAWAVKGGVGRAESSVVCGIERETATVAGQAVRVVL